MCAGGTADAPATLEVTGPISPAEVTYVCQAVHYAEPHVYVKLDLQTVTGITCDDVRVGLEGNLEPGLTTPYVVGVVLPSQIPNVSLYSLKDCKNLKSVDIGEKAKSIDEWAFKNCENLQNVTIPYGVTNIKSNAFRNCKNLDDDIYIPETVTTIGQESFRGCAAFKEITLPESLVSIDKNAFRGCDDLESVLFLGCIDKISDDAFNYCKKITSVTVLGYSGPYTGKLFHEDQGDFAADYNRSGNAPGTYTWNASIGHWIRTPYRVDNSDE
jgi:hypothetical protein